MFSARRLGPEYCDPEDVAQQVLTTWIALDQQKVSKLVTKQLSTIYGVLMVIKGISAMNLDENSIEQVNTRTILLLEEINDLDQKLLDWQSFWEKMSE